jgi:hypothetical protein
MKNIKSNGGFDKKRVWRLQRCGAYNSLAGKADAANTTGCLLLIMNKIRLFDSNRYGEESWAVVDRKSLGSLEQPHRGLC